MNREAIYSALFARLQNAYAWNTASRRLLHWSDVTALQQPAMFLAQAGEQPQTISHQPSKWKLNVKVWVYANCQTAAGPAASSVLNPLLDAVQAAIAPNGSGLETQTLGGLVEWVRIEGNIETDEGLLGDQAVAVIPVTLLTAS
jgi:hypothetical protein